MGKLQRWLCEHVASLGTETTFESLRWEMFGQGSSNDVEGVAHRRFSLRAGTLPKTWNSSLKRALDGLPKQGEHRIRTEKRKLSSLEEFTRHYPGKTLDAVIRELRLKLLPALVSPYLSAALSPRYSAADNEDFYLKTLGKSRVKAIEAMWKLLEPQLVAQLAHLNDSARRDMFLLLARAKKHFETLPVECGVSISQSTEALIRKQILPEALQEELSHFSEALLPPLQLGALGLKSFIHSVTHIPSSGRDYRLKKQAVRSLEEQCVEYLATLPGYEPPLPPRKTTSFRLYDEKGPEGKHSDQVYRVLDKTVFEEFVFIRFIG